MHTNSIVDIQKLRPDCIVVLGMHRSGTSLCSMVLQKLGINMVESDDLYGDLSNPELPWERSNIVEAHNAILRAFGQTWFSAASLPTSWWYDPSLIKYKRDLLDIASTAANAGAWGFNDPRAMRLFPLWLDIFQSLSLSVKVILCIRNPQNVAHSLQRHNNLDENYGKLLWLRHHVEFFQHTVPFPVKIIDYDDWFSNPVDNVIALRSFLNILDKPSEMHLCSIVEECVRPELKRAESRSFAFDFCQYVYKKIVTSRIGNNGSAVVDDAQVDLYGKLELMNRYYDNIYRDYLSFGQLNESVANLKKTIEVQNRQIVDFQHAVRTQDMQLKEYDAAFALANAETAKARQQALEALAAAQEAKVGQEAALVEADMAREQARKAMASVEDALRARDKAMADTEEIRRQAQQATATARQQKELLSRLYINLSYYEDQAAQYRLKVEQLSRTLRNLHGASLESISVK